MDQLCYEIILTLIFCMSLNSVFSLNAMNKTERLIAYTIPEKRELKQALGYDEDTYLNFTELASKYNYANEEHVVTTEDGYLLTIFRILPKCKEPMRLFPVLLMHGVLDSADGWIIAGPELGIGYVLAQNCYDVWLANHRGNSYSRRHITFDADTDPEFWEYTFDEHGDYDLPATIDYVLQNTGKPKINFIGHSQGTTNFFVMNSLRPNYNEKINLSIHLAPIAWLKNIRSVISKIAAQGSGLAKQFLSDIGVREFLGKNHILHAAFEALCQVASDEICGTALSLTVGYVHGTINPKRLSVIFGHALNGVSIKNSDHFGQLIRSGKFQRYDEGRRGNIKRYGLQQPPKYNVSLVSAPVVLVSSKRDWLSSKKDVKLLSSKLPNVLENYEIPLANWSHNNHLWDDNIKEYLFPKIFEYLNAYN